VIGWIHGNKFQGDEVLGFFIMTGLFGMVFGYAGAKLVIILDRFRRHGTMTPST
jgi:23S rRNA G2069 N7-methylase RlmK/C1962 C5-methylase RlmI